MGTSLSAFPQALPVHNTARITPDPCAFLARDLQVTDLQGFLQTPP